MFCLKIIKVAIIKTSCRKLKSLTHEKIDKGEIEELMYKVLTKKSFIESLFTKNSRSAKVHTSLFYP
jgi:hypothetical protein